MDVKGELERIVGAQCVVDDRGTLERYSKDQSFVEPRLPEFVVFPKEVEEVQAILRLCNQTLAPVIPYSSGLNLRGATIPDHGGIILNLSRMNRILDIDEKNWLATIEPGVTYCQLQDELERRGFRLMVPWGVPAKRSVLSSYMERDPMLASASFEYGNYLLFDAEFVLPEGQLFRTGCWNLGGRPGGSFGPVRNNLYRLFTGAQGTLAVVTKVVLAIQHLSSIRKVFFLPFESLEDAVGPIQQIQRREIGWECFGINRLNLAALLTDEFKIPEAFPARSADRASAFLRLRKKLPAWTFVVGLSGLPRFPEERVAYEERALREVCRSFGLKPRTTLPGTKGLGELFLGELLRPWGVLKKFRYKGSVHDLSFKVPLKTAPRIEKLVGEMASARGYDSGDTGGYVLLLERGRAVHCEFDLHCDLTSEEEAREVRSLWLAMSKKLIEEGCLFDRPYGAWAPMVFDRTGQHAIMLKQIKREIDPQNILNPGKLCFA
jgi:FAD/FMN-containing dehydrogenase